MNAGTTAAQMQIYAGLKPANFNLGTLRPDAVTVEQMPSILHYELANGRTSNIGKTRVRFGPGARMDLPPWETGVAIWNPKGTTVQAVAEAVRRHLPLNSEIWSFRAHAD